jgi:hypothetical protein
MGNNNKKDLSLIECESGLAQNWINKYDKFTFQFLKGREFLDQFSN